MDTIQFEIKFDYLPDLQTKQLAVEALINGQPVVCWTAIPIDILALLSSLDGSGNYFIWTCTCGIAECAGMDKGVGVVYTPTSVIWNTAEFPLDNSGNLTFDRAAYVTAVREIWAEYVRYYKSYRAAGIAFEPCPGLFEPELLAKMNSRHSG